MVKNQFKRNDEIDRRAEKRAARKGANGNGAEDCPALKSLAMTAHGALETANDAARGDRLRRYERVCGPRGDCRREALTNDPGRWTWCADCLTVYDDYGKAVNGISGWHGPH